LIVGLYDSGTFERAGLASGSDSLQLAMIEVERPPVPPSPTSLDLAVQRSVRAGQAEVIGWRFNRLGSDHDAHAPLHAGEPLNVILFWRATVDAPSLPNLTLQILDDDERLAAEWPLPPGEHYPPAAWNAGEIVRDPRVYLLPESLAAGKYQLVLAEGQRRATLGDIIVQESARP
jgi:hypothetical protein